MIDVYFMMNDTNPENIKHEFISPGEWLWIDYRLMVMSMNLHKSINLHSFNKSTLIHKSITIWILNIKIYILWLV